MKLAKALAALLLVTVAALACAADDDPPAAIGRLNYVSGQVSFAPAQSDEDWVAASLNRPITTGDRLWTDAGGRAEMHVGSLAVRMDSQTSLDVLNLDDRALQLRLAQGSVNVRVRHATSGEPVEIATPGGAVILKRPGAYRVSVDSQGYATSIAVRGGGQVEVFAPSGSFVVRNGEQATLSASREDVAVAPAPDEFDRWAAQRDGREDRVAATRYVPAEMTGYEDLDQYGAWRTVPEYGTVWQPAAVSADWAPYRYGHWVWIAPWGWTWVDDAPWGFAPSHYGRWIWLGRSWAWAPGRIVARPVYAPALVAFIGGPNFSVSIGGGAAPAVGWVPLGWHEPYRPWYRASQAHVRNVNISNVTNINVTNVRYANRGAPSGVTVVSRENFAAARPVQRAVLKVSPRTVAAAPVTAGAPVSTPSTASLAQARPGARPPAEIRRRQAVAVSAPSPVPARTVLRDNTDDRPRSGPAPDSEHPGVRVIDRRERSTPEQAGSPRAAEKQAQSAPPAATANVRERAPEKAEARQREGGERPVPAPPAGAATRPTLDRSGRVQEAPHREAHDQAQRQQQARQPAQGQTEQRNQQQAQRPAQQRVEEQQARQREQVQRAEQQTRQRAQEQAAHQQQERQAHERAQVEARQREQTQRADQQTRQRAQQQTEQRSRQQAEHQAQQRAQVEARKQQVERAEKQAQQGAQHEAQRAREERRESHEKGGRERARAEKSDKG